MKLYFLLLISILLISCSDNINDIRYRNHNYIFYKENGKVGKWLKINSKKNFKLPKSHSTYFYPDGNKNAELIVSDSFPNRKLRYFDLESNLTKTVLYRADTINRVNYEEGYNKFYHSNLGVLASEGLIKNGKEHGLWKRYNSDGKLIRELYFKNGVEQGKRTDYYASGTIKSISNWDNGLQNGIAKYWYESGKIQEINYVNNKELHGECIEYYESGQIESREHFWKGKRIDTCKYYFENGGLRIVQIYDLDTVSLESKGIQRNYFPTGELKAEIKFFNNKSELILYYKNGNIREISEKIDDLHNGPVTVFHQNGNKMFDGNISYGKYEGKIKMYNDSGELTKTVSYNYGKPIDSIMH